MPSTTLPLGYTLLLPTTRALVVYIQKVYQASKYHSHQLQHQKWIWFPSLVFPCSAQPHHSSWCACLEAAHPVPLPHDLSPHSLDC